MFRAFIAAAALSLQLAAAAVDIHSILIAIYSRMNTFVPINKIPPELLVKIFEYTLSDDQPTLEDFLTQPNHHRWRASRKQLTDLTHICQLWRHVALDASLLWNAVDLGHTERFQTYMRRSCELPVSVEVSAYDQKCFEDEQGFLDLLERYSDRIRRLDVVTLNNRGDLQRLWPRRLARLECVTLSTRFNSPPRRETPVRSEIGRAHV